MIIFSMRQKVYIETSIPSFYYEDRVEAEVVVRKEWTREWWDKHSHKYILVSSPAVLDELKSGEYDEQKRKKAIELISQVPLVAVESAIADIVQAYIQHKVMPNNPVGDALHLALASYHKCDFLLTWNCKHLANANKFHHIRRVNTILGLYIPLLVTPLELLGEDENVER
ncbi:type II toxin-antitoxin system VapC family toxin [candidate division KSB1 bacterium]|nr:type II toxin-antitoxin system VapC family toxin [candidate division KSB1 bacterium]